MREKFMRFYATDDIELCGVLFEPFIETKVAVIHVHGLASNFFENRFISHLSNFYTSKNYAFVSFNNRGYGYFSELLKGNKKTIKGGAAYEIFEECVYDIEGVIQYLMSIGYDTFLLEGHSLGCNKVVYAYHVLKDKYPISKLILLAPCDVYKQLSLMIKDYDSFLKKNVDYCNSSRELDFVPNGLFPLEFTAKTVVNNYGSGVSCDIFSYRRVGYIHPLLKSIMIPVFIIIGSKDECVFTEKKEAIEHFLYDNITDLNVYYIDGAKHIFKGQEEKLVKVIGEFI